MMVEGKNVTAEQAAEMGLVNKVWEAANNEAFMKLVREYAHEFVPPNRAALAVGRIKRSVQSGSEGALEQGLALERELQAELFASHDAKEGISAYVEKRKPTFRAR